VNEKVLVVEEGRMEGLKGLPGVSTRAADLSYFFNEMIPHGQYMDREAAEETPEYKQLIPYVVLCTGAERVLVYKRTKKSGEGRLHDKKSIGIGGHVNPVDGKDPMQAFLSSVSREIDEELEFSEVPKTESLNVVPVGLIYDPSNEVGKVHLGLVIKITVAEEGLALPEPRDPAVAEFEYANLEDLKENPPENLENWSKMALEIL